MSKVKTLPSPQQHSPRTAPEARLAETHTITPLGLQSQAMQK